MINWMLVLCIGGPFAIECEPVERFATYYQCEAAREDMPDGTCCYGKQGKDDANI